MSTKQNLEDAKKALIESSIAEDVKTICVNALNYQIYMSSLANITIHTTDKTPINFPETKPILRESFMSTVKTEDDIPTQEQLEIVEYSSLKPYEKLAVYTVLTVLNFAKVEPDLRVKEGVLNSCYFVIFKNTEFELARDYSEVMKLTSGYSFRDCRVLSPSEYM